MARRRPTRTTHSAEALQNTAMRPVRTPTMDEFGHVERVAAGAKTTGGAIINRANLLHHTEIYRGWMDDARLLPFERDTARKAVELLENALKRIVGE